MFKISITQCRFLDQKISISRNYQNVDIDPALIEKASIIYGHRVIYGCECKQNGSFEFCILKVNVCVICDLYVGNVAGVSRHESYCECYGDE